MWPLELWQARPGVDTACDVTAPCLWPPRIGQPCELLPNQNGFICIDVLPALLPI